MADSGQIRAALFDLDDTLIDRQAAYDHFYRSFYDQHEAINGEISWPEAKDFFWTLSPDNATNPREAFETIQKRWPGVTGDPETHYHNYFKGMVKGMRLLPGAGEFIDALNESGLPWGVVTNGNNYQLEKLRATGIEDRVPFVIATELHGPNKPAPEPYLHALRLLELEDGDAASVLFVGDNPHTDIIGAHRVGMRTAWIHMGRDYPADVPAPHMTIDDVTDLYDILSL